MSTASNSTSATGTSTTQSMVFMAVFITIYNKESEAHAIVGGFFSKCKVKEKKRKAQACSEFFRREGAFALGLGRPDGKLSLSNSTANFSQPLRKLLPTAPELCYSYPGALLQSSCSKAPGLLEKSYGLPEHPERGADGGFFSPKAIGKRVYGCKILAYLGTETNPAANTRVSIILL